MKKLPPGPKWYEVPKRLAAARRNYVKHFASLHAEFGDYVRFRLSKTVILVSDPNGAQYYLKQNAKNYRKSAFFDELRPLLGEGLLTSDGEVWKRDRKLLAPEFQFQNLPAFSKIILTEIEKTIERWEMSLKTSTVLDLADEMMDLTFRIAGASFFGEELGDDAEKVARALTIAQATATRRIMSVFKLPQTFPTPNTNQQRRAVTELNGIAERVIEGRRRHGGPKDLIGRLLDAPVPLTNEQIRDEVLTFMLAGHETTSNALSWTWYLLSQNRGAAENLSDELKSVLGGRLPSYEDLEKLPYTKQVILEAMRIYPPAPVLSRNSIHEDEIGGYYIPANTVIETSMYVVHRHKGWWEEPLQFRPERFTSEAIAKRHPFVYFPFGIGPRECIGKNFAMVEAQLALASLFQKFSVKLLEGETVDEEPLITLRPRRGLKMEVRRH